MVRGAAGLTVVWLISCSTIALPALWEPAAALLGETSVLALAAWPWIAWMGLPLASTKQDGGVRAPSWTSALLAVPPLAAGLAIDRGRGAAWSDLALVGLLGLTMIVLLAHSAVRAARGRRSHLLQALAWLALVPGPVLLRIALELGGAPPYGAAPRWLAFLSEASPIAWTWRCAQSGNVVPAPWASLTVCLVLCAIAEIDRSPDRELAMEPQT